MENQTVKPADQQEQLSNGGHYASVNGLKMYYEIHGTNQSADQPPLVLLHGSLSATGTSFGQVLPLLEKTRKIIAVEQQAHGHTADIDRPLTIEQMGEDTVALLRQLGIRQADFFGYSLGTGIALYIAIRHPAMVRKLALAGGVTYNRQGFHPGMLEGLDGLKPEYLVGSPFYDEYMQIAPRPEDFPRLIEKVKALNKTLHDWSPDEIRSIQAPTLLIIGDADIVQPEHVVEMFRLLGGGVVGDNVGLPSARLAILPGTTHVTLVQRADWLGSMLSEFFA
ncbi:MAG TPA: alpha/beta hydrolase [Aggregatilineaceae bacterium]|nr:alpha/beta hydrolase [Aggregatilineaceae bacterium]